MFLYFISDLPEISKHNFVKELIVVLTHNNLWLFKLYSWNYHSIVPDCQQLVYHCLVCPLIEQGSDWIFFSVKK